MKVFSAEKGRIKVEAIARGIARVIDLSGVVRTRTVYVYKTCHGKPVVPQDLHALASDWNAIGRDFQTAIVRYEQETDRTNSAVRP